MGLSRVADGFIRIADHGGIPARNSPEHDAFEQGIAGDAILAVHTAGHLARREQTLEWRRGELVEDACLNHVVRMI